MIAPDIRIDQERRALAPGPGGLSRRDLLALVPAAAGAAAVWSACGTPVGVSDAPTRAGALPDQLWRASAGDLAAAIRTGDVSSVEVVEAFLARIEEVNPTLNAVTRVLADEALEGAAASDAAISAGAELGPLHGVPFTIKENIDVLGSPTTQGVPALADNMPAADAPIVARLKGAGAVPLARTNLPDFALRAHTDSSLHGVTRNPWHLDRNVGGSSGGDASALAAGMTPLGVGNDIGGSLRVPAQCNGIASLKPTFGRLPRAGGGVLSGQLMAVDGPMGRRVADLATAYGVMAGYDPRDPWSMPLAAPGVPTGEPVRVALVPEPSGGPTHPAVAEGVRRAGEALAAAGYAVEEVEPPRLVDAARTWALFIGTEIQLAMPELREMMSEEAYRFLSWSLEVFDLQGSLPEYVGVLAERHALAAEWQLFQTDYPLIVGPILTQPPFEIGFDIESIDNVADLMEQMRFEVVLNLLGLPAACVPVGIADGLPQVVEVVGGRYQEDLCLQGGQVLEDAFGILTPIDPRGA